MVVYNNVLAGAAGSAGGAAYTIERSLRFNDDDAANLSRTPSSAGNRRTFTFALWVKLCELTATGSWLSAYNSSFTDANFVQFYYTADAKIRFSGTTEWFKSSAVLRDPSAWYHVCLSVDTTLSTAADRVKVYLNGVEIEKGSGTDPSQNYEFPINNTFPHYISTYNGSAEPFDGYLADIYMIDGSAISPVDNFIELDDNGVYQAKEYTGTFGTNGFHLDFSDATSTTTIAEDSSGNDNDFTANNISVTAGSGNDSMFDAPTNGSQSDTGAGGEVSGNYATLNPLDSNIGSNLANGNLDAAGSSNWSAGHARGTFGLTSGKWYWEVTRTGGSGATAQIGFCNKAFSLTETYGTLPANSWTFAFGNGTQILRPSGVASSYFSGSAMGVGDTAGIALDMDNQTAVFYKNGTAGASIDLSATSTGSTDNIDELFPLVGVYNANVAFNGGQRPFAYTAPSGYKALCTTNLPTPTIADGSDYFDISLYSGTGNSGQTVSGLAFSPDLVWFKSRSAAQNHAVFDTVRGVEKRLHPNLTQAEDDSSSGLTAFNSDGFTFGSNNVNGASSTTYAAWAWDAGSSTVSNTDGSITSSVRANQTAGFSIVSYTGDGNNATIGHGLNAAPEFIIQKRRNEAQDWNVYHSANGKDKSIILNTTAASYSSTTWNNTAPTSSVFSIVAVANPSGKTHIAYCFAPVEGYSAFGSYEGTGNSDGPFVYTGFKPAFLMWKLSSASGGHWNIEDNGRSPVNPVTVTLRANTNEADLTTSQGQIVDLLSNGFKVRNTSGQHNTSGATYIYMAFAENPFQANGGLAR